MILGSGRGGFHEEVEVYRDAIVFIDEIDTVQGRGGSDRSADAWFTAIVTCLLECLDGIGRREGVVVIAACNDDANLDAALVRAGRLDRRFWIDLPDEASLAGIFRHHLGDGIDPSAIDRVATLFAGTLSGADVVRIARDARRRARLAGRPLQTEDLIAVAVPGDERASAVRRRIAIHGAGHAVARMQFGQVPTSLVKRPSKLTPYRRPKLTPYGGGCLPGPSGSEPEARRRSGRARSVLEGLRGGA